MVPWLLILAALWLPVTYLLGAQWSLLEQYHYGWAVPFMCAFFAYERSRIGSPSSVLRPPSSALRCLVVSGLVVGGLCLWATRILQEANPLWRATSYALVCEVGAATLLLIYLQSGWRAARFFIFPIAFFLVAVPWPWAVENGVTQSLMRLNTAIVVELLNLFGVPALAHGNVIEISTGVVGVEEACSGIRSLQATLMITLFFGEFYRLRWVRRIGLIFCGIAFAMLSNICRTYFLVWIAARDGTDAIHKWHDPAGVFVLLVCFLGTWALASFFRNNPGSRSALPVSLDASSKGSPPSSISNFPTSNIPPSVFRPPWSMAIFILAFILIVEISTEAWFRLHEKGGAHTASWRAQWPKEDSTFQPRLLGDAVKNTMKFDEESAGSWMDSEDRQWQGIYLRWNSSGNFYSRARAALAKGHRPEACLPASGLVMESQLTPGHINVGNFTFVFNRYVFRAQEKPLFVFFLVVDEAAQATSAEYLSLERTDRITMALAGKRSGAQQSLEVAITGFSSAEEAWQALQKQLPNWIRTIEEKAEK